MARVLIVDDDAICRAIAVEALSQDGHVCQEAEDGEVATRRLAHTPMDLVITDLLMPNKEGIETIMEIRKLWPGMKIIAMSGGSGAAAPDQLLKMAARLGADETLIKPLRAQTLKEAVWRVLAGP
jgi:CheY-like chemotaxis protein